MKSIAIALTLLATGCFQTTLRTKNTAHYPSASHDGRWRHAFIAGIVDAEGPVLLDEACPNGFAEIESRVSPANYLLTTLTYGVYTPQEVTVRCASEERKQLGAPASKPEVTPTKAKEPGGPRSVFDDRWTD